MAEEGLGVGVDRIFEGGGPFGWGSGTGEKGCVFIKIGVKEVIHSGLGAISEQDGLCL